MIFTFRTLNSTGEYELLNTITKYLGENATALVITAGINTKLRNLGTAGLVLIN